MPEIKNKEINQKMNIKKNLKFMWDEFIYGGHLTSLGAVSIVFTSAILLDIKITWDCLLATYLIVQPVYLYNRYKEFDEDFLTNKERTQHIKKYFKYIPLIIFCFILILFGILLYFSNFLTLFFGFLLLFFGFLYSVFLKKLTKKIIGFKNFCVSLLFSLLVFFLIIYYSYSLTIPILSIAFLFMIFIYFKAFMIQVFLDVKDIESDKKEKLLTFPIIFGKEKTLNILGIISILSTALIPIIFSLYFNVFSVVILMLLLTIPFNIYCFTQAKKQKYFSYIIGGGEFILYPILIIIGKILI